MSKAESQVSPLGVEISPRTVARRLLQVTAVVVALHLATGFLFMVTGAAWADGVFSYFNMNDETNVPTFFTIVLWLSAAALCWLLARSAPGPRRDARPWLAIGAICVFIALDEMTSLHERLNEPLRTALDLDGFLYYAWVIPYAALALAVVALLGRFVWRLEHPVNRLIMLAGAVYVAGAMGLEPIEGALTADTAEGERESNLFVAVATLEETLELLGLTIFLYALLVQLQKRARALQDPAAELISARA